MHEVPEGSRQMMNYEVFRQAVTEKFKDYLSEEYKDMELFGHPAEEVNRSTPDGLNLGR